MDDEELVVSKVAVDTQQAKLTITNVPDRIGFAARIFHSLSTQDVMVDMIIQDASERGMTDISFTVPRSAAQKASIVLETISHQVQAGIPTVDDKVAKVSVLGRGMRTQANIASKMFRALAEKGINIEMISTSEITISVIIREEMANEAQQALEKAFRIAPV